jgi:ferrous iron transport protein A
MYDRQNSAQRLELARTRPGMRVRVVGISGGWELRQRLNQMGIHIDDQITVKQVGVFKGPMLVEVHGSQVALGCGMARKVIVEIMTDQSGS